MQLIRDIIVDAENHGKRAPLDTCYTYTCSNVGQSCLPNITATPYQVPICTGGFCNQTSALDPNSVCAGFLADGSSCAAGQCQLSSTCIFADGSTNGVCKASTSQEPAGGICKTDSDCEYSTCSNGICNGLAAGASCTDDGQCSPPNLCINNACAAPLGSGAACDASNDKCSPNYYCVPATPSGGTSGTCVAFGSANVGDACTSPEQCPDGSGCYMVGETDIVGTCVIVPSQSTGISCNAGNNTGCGQYETCQCNGNNGQNQCLLTTPNNPTGFRASVLSALNCVTQKCNTPSQACIYTTCLNAYCNVADTLSDTQYQFYSEMWPKCLVNYYVSVAPAIAGCSGATTAPSATTGATSSASIVAASSAIAGLVMVGALLA